VAVVRIDGGVAADLPGGAFRSFRLTPGKHTVVVRIRKRLWLYGCRDKAIVALPLDLEAGEDVGLVCGVRPEAQKIAALARRAEFDLILHVFLTSMLALVVGWSAQPFVHRFIERAADRLGVSSYWLPFALWMVGSPLATALWAILIWWVFLGRFSVERKRRLVASLKAEIVEPYFLKRVECHGHGPVPNQASLLIGDGG
jgi:hypothetical protein